MEKDILQLSPWPRLRRAPSAGHVKLYEMPNALIVAVLMRWWGTREMKVPSQGKGRAGVAVISVAGVSTQDNT